MHLFADARTVRFILTETAFGKIFLGGAAAILLLSLLFTAIVLCDLFDPFDVETQRHENIRRTGEARENYLAKSVE